MIFFVFEIFPETKFEPYLEHCHFLHMVSEKQFFSRSKLVVMNPKLAAILARPKQPCEFTDCITLKPRSKFTVIMREETSILSLQKTSLEHLRAVKQFITVALYTEEEEVES